METKTEIVRFNNKIQTARFIDAEGTVEPKTMALHFLMSVTGISEITNEEQVRNFLYRMHLVFQMMKIEPGKIAQGELFPFMHYNQEKFSFSIADLKERMGISIDMIEMETCDETEFLATIPQRYKFAYINEIYFEEQELTHFDSPIVAYIFSDAKEKFKYPVTTKMKELSREFSNLIASLSLL